MKVINLLSILRNVRIVTLEKGETLIREGSSCTDIFFIRKGLVRSFRASKNVEQEETTFQLFAEHHVGGNIHTIFLKEPSSLAYEAIERTKVYLIDFNLFNREAAKNPELGEFSRRFLGKRMVKQAFLRVESFVFLSAEERYEKYKKDHPEIINRAPDKYIANILGITPTSLSRIRKRISTKNN